MCTAATYKTKNFYFGRTLDYEFSYGEQVVIAPRKYPFSFKREGRLDTHYAIIGMAHVAAGVPLYYDAINEKGLCMAGLNFVGNAKYFPPQEGKINVAQYEFIPYILGKCADVNEAKKVLEKLNLIDIPFSEKLPTAELHWLIADTMSAITVECTADGLHIYDDRVGVLTNNPPFPMQMFNLNNYMSVSAAPPENTFAEGLPLKSYSRGMGGIGLPGDLSSMSRFVRVAFTRMNAVSGDSEGESVSQFFHILGSVEQQKGCCRLEKGECEYTIYTSCCNADKGIYYYKTYDTHRIFGVDMHREDLDAASLIAYPLVEDKEPQIQNK